MNSFGTHPTNSLNRGLSVVLSRGAASHSDSSGSCTVNTQADRVLVSSCGREVTHRLGCNAVLVLLVLVHAGAADQGPMRDTARSSTEPAQLSRCCCQRLSGTPIR